MKVAIIGTGNVGLVSGACFAAKGHDVVCVDLDAERVAAINQGQTPFYEPGLEELLRDTIGRRLHATLDLGGAVATADIVVLAVGTPFNGETIDLDQIRHASRQVGKALVDNPGYPLVMVKSTVLPGTTDTVVTPILEEQSGQRAAVDFGVAMNPEFLREGQAVGDFMMPDRIVMGATDERSWAMQDELYRDFPAPDVVRTDNRTAEMIKYTSNALLANLISFSNEIGNLCATLPGVDIAAVMRGVHLDKRLSPIVEGDEPTRLRPGILSYLMAGCGFGGSCLPKDVSSLIAFGDSQGSPMDLLRSVMTINHAQPGRVVELARRQLPSLDGVEVAVLGLSFKPGTSDIRLTPALPVIAELREAGARLRLYDPAALDEIGNVLGEADELAYHAHLEDAIDGAELIVVLTSWPELRRLPELLADRDPAPVVIDGRRMFDREDFARYDGIGLGPRS
ncbi:MAG: UDP-glucose/GDP-mannose dehydrogenase family protein [Acidobacteriota bacterium]